MGPLKMKTKDFETFSKPPNVIFRLPGRIESPVINERNLEVHF